MANDLTRTLHHDHQEVKDIFKQMSKGGSEAQMRKLCAALEAEIVPHMKGEEKHIYPALMKAKEAKEDTLEAIEEHRVAERVLNELMKMNPKDETFMAKTKVLKEMIEHHIEEEEGNIFDFLDDMKDTDSLLQQFSKTKEEAKSKIQTKH